MEKIKALLLKYKYWVAGAVALLVIFYLMRQGGGGSGGGAIQTQYTTASGNTANSYTDPSIMMAQLAGQNALAVKTLENQGALDILSKQNDLIKFQTQSSETLGLATIDANKFMANLDSTTQNTVAQLGFNSAQYTANIQQQIANSNNILAGQQIDANKYIANLQANTEMNVVNKQASIAKYQAQTDRRGQDYSFAAGLLQFAGGFFK